MLHEEGEVQVSVRRSGISDGVDVVVLGVDLARLNRSFFAVRVMEVDLPGFDRGNEKTGLEMARCCPMLVWISRV